MAKTKRKQPPQAEPEAPFLWPWEWREPEMRLDLMEARSRVALREGHAAARILVADVPMPDLPGLWTPGQASGILLGPDGKPLGSPSA